MVKVKRIEPFNTVIDENYIGTYCLLGIMPNAYK